MKINFSKYTDVDTYKRIVSYATMVEMWNNVKENYRGKVALRDGSIFYTYAEMNQHIAEKRYHLFHNLGIRAGDRVGIYMSNSIEFVELFLAITTLGAVAVLCPIHWTEEKVHSIQSQLNIPYIFKQEDMSSFESDASMRCGHVTPDMPCTIIFTSGTSDSPKGVVLSHQAVLAGTMNGCYGLKNVFQQNYLLILPLTHVFGLIRSCLTALYTGSTICMAHGKTKLFEDLQLYQPTVLILVPALVELGLKLSRQYHKNMFGNQLKYIICGAATVSPRLIKQCARWGIEIFPGYGLTEASNMVSGNPDPVNHPESVGYIYNNLSAKIINDELYLKGPSIFSGYATHDGADNSSIHDGWLATGDLAKITQDGMLILLGRKDDVIIKSNGENISPAELENFFLQSDLIQDCLVYRVKKWKKDRIVLEVLPASGVINKDYSSRQLLKNLKDKNLELPHFKQVDKIIVRKTDFARTSSMKIIRQ